jgi:hypothetical protein
MNREVFAVKKRTLVTVALLAGAMLVLSFPVESMAKKSVTQVEKVKKKGKVGEENVIEKSDTKIPKFVFDKEIEIGREKGEKAIFVKVDVTNKDRRAAERLAEGELRKRIAEGIKTLVDSQFKEAMSGTETSFSESFESYVWTVADKVPVVGLIVTDTYWEKVQKFTSKKEFEVYYRIVKRAKMPYANYAKSRDNAWQEVLDERETDEEKEDLQRIIDAMKKGDEL